MILPILYAASIFVSFLLILMSTQYEDLISWDYVLAILIALIPVLNIIAGLMFFFHPDEVEDYDNSYTYEEEDHVHDEY